MPVRYAMTMGELARMFNAENKIGADLHVIAMKNWTRGETYDRTGLALDSAVTEPAHGRMRHFCIRGSKFCRQRACPWDAARTRRLKFWARRGFAAANWRRRLNARKIPGVSFAPAQFTPTEDAI